MPAGRRRRRPARGQRGRRRPCALATTRPSRARNGGIRVTMGPVANAAGLVEGERLVLRFHPHWKTVLRPLLILAVTVAALLVVLTVVPSGSYAIGVRLAL